ncbi:hypothetical protein B0H10DRAFT_2019347 [Mycena sp. CBHHK59/15]|nr:hypothetical protein B0H10DRAFT_2019347 [Mycena sp. CBHHK59/15]
MPVLPTKKEMQEMKRPELQKLCKDYGVKANLKTDALIELLLDTKKANPRTAPPPPARRSVSTRHSSRSGPRISSVVIHDTDDEEEDENEQEEIDEEETENHPEPDPEPILVPTRTRKAKDTQTRLGVGRPVAAGGNGPRAVTKSVSITKGKRGRNNKSVKPAEDTIPEEAEEEQPSHEPSDPADLANAGPAATSLENVQPVAPMGSAPVASTSNSSAEFANAVADALRPVYQQLESLKSELEQLPIMKTELAQLRKQVADKESLEQKVVTLTTQVEHLRAQSATTTALSSQLKQLQEADMVTTASRSTPNPATPHFQSPMSKSKSRDYAVAQSLNASSSDSKTAGAIDTSVLPNPGIAPSMLGKRQRESTSSNLTGVIEEGEEAELSKEELAKKVVRPTKKRPKLLEEEEDVEASEALEVQIPPRIPSFTVFSGEEEPYIDPPPPTEGLPDFYDPASPTGSGGSRQGPTTSTLHASENQHPFSFSFLPISSTPANSIYTLPSFPYPEAPQSPSPAGPVHGGTTRNHGERTDIFQSFGLPPPGRPRSRVTAAASGSGSGSSQDDAGMGAFVDPAALTRRSSDQQREDVAAGFGFMRADNDEDIPAMKRTMYGTELDGDTRFGDFGIEGVASGFWAGSRF